MCVCVCVCALCVYLCIYKLKYVFYSVYVCPLFIRYFALKHE